MAEFVPALQAPSCDARPTWWFLFRDGHLLVTTAGGRTTVPRAITAAELGVAVDGAHYLGALDGRGCNTAELDADGPLPEGVELQPLRALYGQLDEALFAVAGRAVQIVAWDRTHRYCGRCGAGTAAMPGERAKRCPACGLIVYPRLTPAVIVLVTRGDEVLLARSPHFSGRMSSVLAGFVEAGESLEEAVAREIREETSIAVAEITYFGSQPWPYPNSLMIGFTAAYAGGELAIDEREIEDAGWYRRDALPQLPSRPSIARHLLDWWIEQGTPDNAR